MEDGRWKMEDGTPYYLLPTTYYLPPSDIK
jgi:hypothetical protein